jgi:glycosyltransferase involved in cell wall biosynthesis
MGASVTMNVGVAVPVFGFQGGIERYAHDLAASLAARGHRVVALHGAARGKDPEGFARAFVEARSLDDPAAAQGLDVVYVQKPALASARALRAARRLAFAVHDHDLTCARSHRYLPIGNAPCHRAPGIGCVLRGCVVVRERAPGARLPLRLASPFDLRLRVRALAARGPLVACSAYVASGLVAAGARADRVRVLHPIPPFDPEPTTPRPSAPRLVVVGQLLRGKGVDLAIHALRALPRDVTLEVVGDGPSRAELERLAARVAPGRVRFAGFRGPDGVRAAYDAASVVVVPSRWPEPFGMVGVEAMRRRRPVVAAAHGGIPEWLEEGRGGRLFEPGNPADLARATGTLLADVDAGDRAEAEARRRFSREAFVDAAERLLAESAAP